MCCEALRDVSLKLQDLGLAGGDKKETSSPLMNEIIFHFNLYKKHLQDLKVEIAKWVLANFPQN